MDSAANLESEELEKVNQLKEKITAGWMSGELISRDRDDSEQKSEDERILAVGDDTALIQSSYFIKSHLKEAKWDMELAEKNIMITLKWRQENSIHSISSELPTFGSVWNPFVYEFIGFAKDGRPVLSIHAKEGSIEMDDNKIQNLLKENNTPERIKLGIRYSYYLSELIISSLVDSGADSIVVILDMQGVPYTEFKYLNNLQSLIPVGFELLNTCTAHNHYPRLLHKMFIINSSKKFAKMYVQIFRRALKRTLKAKPKKRRKLFASYANSAGLSSIATTAATEQIDLTVLEANEHHATRLLKFSKNYKTRIQLLGKKKEKWSPILLEHIAQDQLIMRYGGIKEEKIN